MCEGIEMKAFPSNQPVSGTMGFYADGMELRDYFAAKAMQSYWSDENVASDYKTAAAWAYEMADAMMKAREQ
jgi:hypothetical protein